MTLPPHPPLSELVLNQGTCRACIFLAWLCQPAPPCPSRGCRQKPAGAHVHAGQTPRTQRSKTGTNLKLRWRAREARQHPEMCPGTEPFIQPLQNGASTRFLRGWMERVQAPRAGRCSPFGVSGSAVSSASASSWLSTPLDGC